MLTYVDHGENMGTLKTLEGYMRCMLINVDTG